MSWARRKRILAAFVGGGVVVFAAAALLGGGPARTCSTIGYGNTSPIELMFDPSFEVDAVAACFGSDCQPVALTGADGDWSVPQSADYLQTALLGSITHVRVEAASDGSMVVDQAFEVGRKRDGWTGWPRCPGPYRYLPVSIGP